MDSFGERLKREREKRGVTLDEISGATKIGTRMLRALEEEKFDQLPGGIFNKGFVRAYAQQLHLDEDQAVADYLAAIGESRQADIPESQAQAFPIEIRDERPPGDAVAQIPWGWLAVALLAIALGFALWSLHSQGALPGMKNASPAANESPSSPQGEKNSAASLRNTAPPQSSSLTAATSGSFTVQIKARDDSWVSITVDGKEIMQDTLVAPAVKSVTAQKEVVIKAGNVGALALSFNGKELPTQGDFGQVKTLTFNAAGLQPGVPPPPAPAN